MTRLNTAAIERFATLLNEFGQAQYGDEWWPGNASRWMDDGEALEVYCEQGWTTSFSEPAAANIVRLFIAYAEAKFSGPHFGPAFDLSDAHAVLGKRKASRLHAINDRANEILKSQ